VTQSDKQQRLNAALDLYLVGLAIEGDRQAFDRLYRRWHPRLLRFAFRLTQKGEDAQDVLQEASLIIARDIHKLRDPTRFAGWAYTILRRRAADHIGRAVRSRQTMEAAPEPLASPESELALRQALSQLPEVERLMLTLFYVDGFRGIEIAEALGVPLGTIKSRLFTARRKLKQIYDSDEGDQNDRF